MDDILTLIAANYMTDSIGQKIASERSTDIWVHLQSVGRAEYFNAAQHDLAPELVAVTNIVNYDGQREAIYGGQRFEIYRTYRVDESDEIELYLARRVGA